MANQSDGCGNTRTQVAAYCESSCGCIP
jgi:hypothetical protein